MRRIILFVFDKLSLETNFSCVVPLCPLIELLSPLSISLVQGYLFDMNLRTFISTSLWKPFMFSFSFCPHFIHHVSQTHTALSAFCCCCCCWLFTARQQIAFCEALLHSTSMPSVHTHSFTYIYCKDNSSSFLMHLSLFFYFCFCFFILCFVDS